MARKLISYLILNLAITCPVICYAQLPPMYTQYMFNGLVINPAYAGSKETFTASGIFRKQWVGIEDAPQTQTFSAHSPVDKLRYRKRPGSKVSLGLILFNDQIAITSQTGLHVAYAYRLKLANNANLSMGIQAGVSQFRVRYSELSLDDPSFLTGDIAEWGPDFGGGLYYHTEKFYAGLSIPHFLHTYHDQRKASITSVPQYFMTMGYVFDLSGSVKVKPSYLIKGIKGNPLQVDMNCNVFLSEVFEVGLSWRSFESISTMIQLQVNPRFSFGYAYDLPAGSELAKMSTGSHEMMLSYRTPQKKVRTVNPRYF